MKKKIILMTLVAILVGLTVFTVPKVKAETISNSNNIIQKLVAKFGLKEADVQSIFNEVKTARQTEMQTKFDDRLNQAVKDGKLTEAQKGLIINKHKEFKAKKQGSQNNWQNMTPEQRRAAGQTQRQEIESWANQNVIDLKYFFGGLGGRGGWKHL